MKKILLAACVSAALALPTFAVATDGTVGATSTGSVGLSMTTDTVATPTISITGLQDMDFGIVAPGVQPPSINLSDICIFINNASTYTIELDGGISPSGLGFGVLTTNDGSSTLTRDFFYGFTDRVGTQVVDETPVSGLTPAIISECGSIDMASLYIQPLASPYTGNLNWTGTFTLTVSPD